MHEELERLVGLYDGARITRRELIQGLLAVGMGAQAGPNALGAAAGSGEAAPVFQARTINHVTLYVSDVARSKAFYQSLTGLPVRAEDTTFCELRLENSFLGLYAPDRAERPGIDHFCFGFEQYRPTPRPAQLKALYHSLTGLPVRAEDTTFCELRLENSFLGLYAPDRAER